MTKIKEEFGKKIVSRRNFLAAGGAVIAAGQYPVAARGAAEATASQASKAPADSSTTLTLYDPTGPVEVTKLFAVRSGNTDMNGKTVGFINTGWYGSETIKLLTNLLKRQYPTIKFIQPSDWNVHYGEENAAALVKAMKEYKPDFVILCNAG